MALAFSIQSGALPESAVVAGFRGSEGISRPYAFDVYVHVPGSSEIELEEVVGSRATLALKDGLLPAGSWAGVLASFELVRALEQSALYVARIVPRLWQLSLTRHSRLFTKQSIPEIIEAVLQDEGVTDYELRLAQSYAVEEHVCQYKESSLAFIQRWMEREGMYYFFEQTHDGEKLVITDDKSKHPDAAGGPVRYHPTVGQDRGAGRHFDNLTARHGSLPASVKLCDYNYLKPALDVSGTETVSPSGFGEIQEYGHRFFAPGDGARLARIRAEELRAQAAVYHATGAAAGISAGSIFAVEGHPRLALNKEYVATRVEHFGYVADLAVAWGSLVEHAYDDVYRVEVFAVSADQQYRHPCSTPWPRIDGFENGVIDGPATSEYAQIDEQGRYLVKFKFDEGTLKDGKASTWVRMMQPHGGTTEGFHFPLRKGTEVAFFFLGGDPDRPVIAGVVCNAVTPSPVVSANYTQNIVATGGGNYITMEDQAGSQYVNIYCPVFSTNLYLGVDRPVGGHGLKSPAGPDAVEQGKFKEELGPFHFQLATKGSGEIFTEKNLNLVAYGKLQTEGHAGVIQHSGAYWHQHVKGETKELREQKVHHEYGDVVDYDWKGPYTLDVEKASTLHFKGTYTRTVDGATTVSDKAGLTHFVGAEADMCGADTHFLKVKGTEHHEVTDKQTVKVGAQEVEVELNQDWKTGTNVDWKVGGKFTLDVTGEHEIKSATWHENVFGIKSEAVFGAKNDMVFGLHTELEMVGHLEFHVANFHLDAHIGAITSEIDILRLTLRGVDIKSKNLNVKAEATKAETGGPRMMAVAVRMQAIGPYMQASAVCVML